MVVGLLRVELIVPDASSLKDKRRVVRSLRDRLRHRFNVAVAEVEGQDTWQRAVLGIACLGGESAHVQQMLSEIGRWLEAAAGDMLGRCDSELL